MSSYLMIFPLGFSGGDQLTVTLCKVMLEKRSLPGIVGTTIRKNSHFTVKFVTIS